MSLSKLTDEPAHTYDNTYTMDSVVSAPQPVNPAPNAQLLAAYQDWCKATNTPEPIQSRTITSKSFVAQ
jgi:hypothetical protein